MVFNRIRFSIITIVVAIFFLNLLNIPNPSLDSTVRYFINMVFFSSLFEGLISIFFAYRNNILETTKTYRGRVFFYSFLQLLQMQVFSFIVAVIGALCIIGLHGVDGFGEFVKTQTANDSIYKIATIFVVFVLILTTFINFITKNWIAKILKLDIAKSGELRPSLINYFMYSLSLVFYFILFVPNIIYLIFTKGYQDLHMGFSGMYIKNSDTLTKANKVNLIKIPFNIKIFLISNVVVLFLAIYGRHDGSSLSTWVLDYLAKNIFTSVIISLVIERAVSLIRSKINKNK